jgi:hypothetical protein
MRPAPFESPLEISLEEFSATNVSMREALQHLREKDRRRILIGFEELPDGDSKPLTVNMMKATVSAILQALCDQDPRYIFTNSYNKEVINVFPALQDEYSINLMGSKRFSVDIDVNEYPQNIIRFLDRFIPELSITTSQGSGLPSTETPETTRIYSLSNTHLIRPRIQLKMEEVSLRQILNEIVMYSKRNMEELDFSFPLSWRYQPRVDRSKQGDVFQRPTWALF